MEAGLGGDFFDDAETRVQYRRAGSALGAYDPNGDFAVAPKEIVKEGLSEYFLYTIEGTETIPDGWAKRLPSFAVGEVPVENLYKYEEERWGPLPVRFLAFVNDEDHKLGDTPIPDGPVKAFRRVDEAGRLGYLGSDASKYIPVGEKAELNLGPVSDLVVEPKLMELATDRYLFDVFGNVDGWVETQRWKLKAANHRELPARVEITRNLPMADWELESDGEHGAYEKLDLDTVRYTLALQPHQESVFHYTVRFFHGRRAQER